MMYAAALPGLIKDNIGDAPLTVRKAALEFRPCIDPWTGLDIHSSTYYSNGEPPGLSPTYMEVTG